MATVAPAFLKAVKSRLRFGTRCCSLTLSPKTFQPAPFGLMKSICGSITTSAVRLMSHSKVDAGSAGSTGSA
ncbi:hypothetical protein D9M73_296420 [compost metagenome]